MRWMVLQQSDAQWDAAQKLTAQAAEQSRIAQTRTMEATKFKQTADEARRAADKAHVKEHELEVSSCPSLCAFTH
jgi:hypothetical protein